MDRHPLLLAAVAAALLAAACGGGDSDARHSSASTRVGGEASVRDTDAEFETLAAAYESPDAKIQRPQLRHQLETYGSRAVTWAAGRLVESRDELPFAELIAAAATRADLDVARRALGASRDPMARHRLAATLIRLGDTDEFAVLLEGLESPNAYDRSDAAAMLAGVAHELPRELRPRAVELLRAGLANDAGGVTARGYDKSLRVLGSE